jgi:hypothetical protein
MRSITWQIFLLFVGLLLGLIAGVGIGRSLPVMGRLLVYTDGNANAWEVQGLDEAEKKAHFLIYECDAKLAVITDLQGRIISQVRKSDGRNLGTD